MACPPEFHKQASRSLLCLAPHFKKLDDVLKPSVPVVLRMWFSVPELVCTDTSTPFKHVSHALVLQAKEEEEVVARRVKAGGLGRLKTVSQQTQKHFF